MSNRAIFVLALTLGLTGCFRSSSSDDDPGDPDGGARWSPDGAPDFGFGGTHICSCCGTDVEVSSDQPCELGVCDPYCLGLDCEDRPLDAVCDYSHVTAGVRQDLPVLFGAPSGDECFCPELLQCEATILEDGVLELRTQICSEPGFVCEACIPFVEGRCSLPALTEGTWTVRMDGADAFQLAVASPDVLPEWGRSCDTPASPTTDGCGTLWPPSDARPDSVCHQGDAYTNERVAIEVTHDCPPCNAAAGPCEVTIFDDVVRVETSTLEPACDITCPPVCEERTDTCLTPALPEGIWRVQVAGLEGYESRIQVGAIDEPAGFICGPATSGG